MRIALFLPSVLCGLLLAACGTQPMPAPTTASAARTESCAAVTPEQIAALFDRWNAALATGDPAKLVAQYAPHSILLPTVSNKPRLTAAEKADYFVHFMENQPSGRIDQRFVDIGCNDAVDAGLYTFRFARTGAEVHARYSFTYKLVGGQWLITSHHSSAMPEKQ